MSVSENNKFDTIQPVSHNQTVVTTVLSNLNQNKNEEITVTISRKFDKSKAFLLNWSSISKIFPIANLVGWVIKIRNFLSRN